MWRDKLALNKTNALQKLYPSCKFLVVCLYSVCSIIIGGIKVNIGSGRYPVFLILWFLIVPVLGACSGIWKRYMRAGEKVAIVALVIFLVQTFLIPGDNLLWEWWVFKISEESLCSAISLSFSVLNIAGIFVWMFQTTENKEISRALEDSGINYKVAYVFISTLQMIEVMGKNSKTIMNAQRARGVETEGNIIVRSKAFFPALVPLILGAIMNSEERVLTLESKGFDVACEKTHLFNISRSGKEKAVNIFSVIVTVAVVAWRVLWAL